MARLQTRVLISRHVTATQSTSHIVGSVRRASPTKSATQNLLTKRLPAARIASRCVARLPKSLKYQSDMQHAVSRQVNCIRLIQLYAFLCICAARWCHVCQVGRLKYLGRFEKDGAPAKGSTTPAKPNAYANFTKANMAVINHPIPAAQIQVLPTILPDIRLWREGHGACHATIALRCRQ
eukprot:SAG11_NODE_798_length_7127_cov_8.227803_7_plen_180_part_00